MNIKIENIDGHFKIDGLLSYDKEKNEYIFTEECQKILSDFFKKYIHIENNCYKEYGDYGETVKCESEIFFETKKGSL